MERHCYKQAFLTFKDAVYAMKLAVKQSKESADFSDNTAGALQADQPQPQDTGNVTQESSSSFTTTTTTVISSSRMAVLHILKHANRRASRPEPCRGGVRFDLDVVSHDDEEEYHYCHNYYHHHQQQQQDASLAASGSALTLIRINTNDVELFDDETTTTSTINNNNNNNGESSRRSLTATDRFMDISSSSEENDGDNRTSNSNNNSHPSRGASDLPTVILLYNFGVAYLCRSRLASSSSSSSSSSLSETSAHSVSKSDKFLSAGIKLLQFCRSLLANWYETYNDDPFFFPRVVFLSAVQLQTLLVALQQQQQPTSLEEIKNCWMTLIHLKRTSSRLMLWHETGASHAVMDEEEDENNQVDESLSVQSASSSSLSVTNSPRSRRIVGETGSPYYFRHRVAPAA